MAWSGTSGFRLHISRRIVYGGAALLLLSMIFYQAFLPANTAKAYLTRLDVSAEGLHDELNDLAVTTDRSIFYNPYEDERQIKNDLAGLQSQLAKTERELDAFTADANGLPVLIFTGYLGQYRQAVVSREEAKVVAAQSRDMLGAYNRFIKYLDMYWQQQFKFQRALDAFNSVEDLNVLISRGDGFRAEVESINKSASILRQVDVPAELRRFNASTIQTYGQAAKGFEALAAGVDLGRDDIIYSATRAIEDASTKNDTGDKQLYMRAFARASILKDIAQAPEKTESLLE